MFAPSCCPPFQSLNAHVLSATSTRPTHHHPHHTRTPRAVIMCHSQARTSICSKWMMRTYVPPSRRHANTSASEERSKALSTHFTFHDPNFHPRCIRNQTVFIKMIGAGSFKPPMMHAHSMHDAYTPRWPCSPAQPTLPPPCAEQKLCPRAVHCHSNIVPLHRCRVLRKGRDQDSSPARSRACSSGATFWCRPGE
jgi:hypothetical protein